MITIKIILLILAILNIVWFSNSVPAVINVKQGKDSKILFSKTILIISGIGAALVMFVFALYVIFTPWEREKQKECPKYELVQEPVYKKVDK